MALKIIAEYPVKKPQLKPRKTAASILAITEDIHTSGLYELIGYASGVVFRHLRHTTALPFDLSAHREEVRELLTMGELMSDDGLRVLLKQAQVVARRHPRYSAVDVVTLADWRARKQT